MARAQRKREGMRFQFDSHRTFFSLLLMCVCVCVKARTRCVRVCLCIHICSCSRNLTRSKTAERARQIAPGANRNTNSYIRIEPLHTYMHTQTPYIHFIQPQLSTSVYINHIYTRSRILQCNTRLKYIYIFKVCDSLVIVFFSQCHFFFLIPSRMTKKSHFI